MVSRDLVASIRAVTKGLLEIDPDVDFDSRRAVYFRQMRYGLFVSIHSCYLFPGFMFSVLQVRMALLASVIG